MERIFAAGPWVTEHEVMTVVDALRNGWYEHAYDYCEKFQKEFAAYHGRKYGIMTPNCTTAIHLVLAALGVKDEDEVILPECTWVGSSAGVTYLRAEPVFCDIDADNWCINPDSVLQRITPRTKAVIAVDLFGNMPDMDRLREITERAGLALIEDAAEAVGSVYKGVRAGKFGIASVFSFHRTKTITTGEGGMILLDDDALYERTMFLRDHGRKPDGKPYYNYEIAFKYMPSNVQAALGYAQFQRIEELIERKRHFLEAYRKGLAALPDIQLNSEPPGGINGAWITGLVFGPSYKLDKENLNRELEKCAIPGRPFFYPLSSLPAYPGFRERYEQINPVAYDVSRRGINLPGALEMKDEQITYICEQLVRIVQGMYRK